jgi:hypothetical protein
MAPPVFPAGPSLVFRPPLAWLFLSTNVCKPHSTQPRTIPHTPFLTTSSKSQWPPSRTTAAPPRSAREPSAPKDAPKSSGQVLRRAHRWVRLLDPRAQVRPDLPLSIASLGRHPQSGTREQTRTSRSFSRIVPILNNAMQARLDSVPSTTKAL